MLIVVAVVVAKGDGSFGGGGIADCSCGDGC